MEGERGHEVADVSEDEQRAKRSWRGPKHEQLSTQEEELHKCKIKKVINKKCICFFEEEKKKKFECFTKIFFQTIFLRTPFIDKPCLLGAPRYAVAVLRKPYKLH